MELKKIKTSFLLYGIILIVISIPISCGYIMSGGDVIAWLARIEEVKEGILNHSLILFPSAELVNTYGGHVFSMDSNLWLVFPAVLRLCGLDITSSWRVTMLLLQYLTVALTRLMFRQIFSDESSVIFGVLLYVTCPYRISICYDRANLGRSLAWMLIPLIIYGMIRLYRNKVNAVHVILPAAAFAGICYADGIMASIIMAMILLSCIWYRKCKGLLPLVIGGVFSIPGILPLLKYLVLGGREDLNIPLNAISSSGYRIGQFFTSFAFKSDMPGLGLGLLGAVILLLWISFIEEEYKMPMYFKFFIVGALMLIWASSCYFPWDIMQRLCAPFLRYISLLGSPGIFFGCSCVFVCIPAAHTMQYIRKHERIFVRIGFPLMIAIASIAISVYLCNTLTYTRIPMYLTDTLQ